MEKPQSGQINPWGKLWIHPRATLRAILDTNPFRMIIWLALIGGMVSSLSWLAFLWIRTSQQEIYRTILSSIVLIVFGGLVGIIYLYLGGWLFKVTGSWLGGKGKFTDVKCAIGWANYPFIISGVIATLSCFFIANLWLMTFFGLAQLTSFVWAFIILLKLIAEAHRFNVFQGFCTLLIGFVLIFVAMMLVALILTLLSPLWIG